MFQIIDRYIQDGKLQDDDAASKIIPKEGNVVIDEQLKSQFAGISGIMLWTPDYIKLRKLSVELKIDSREVFPHDFPAEIYSVNPFRNIEDCTLKVDFPANARIEGKVYNNNNTDVPLKIILFVKL
jgi:hypothetical protein